MSDKPVDKTKLNPMANAFMEFFERQFNVTFVDVAPQEEEAQPPADKE